MFIDVAEEISLRFHPNFDGQFAYQHGIFGAIIILCLGALPMPLLQYIIVTRFDCSLQQCSSKQ